MVTFSMQGYKFLAIISTLPNTVGSELKKETAMDITDAIQPVISKHPEDG